MTTPLAPTWTEPGPTQAPPAFTVTSWCTDCLESWTADAADFLAGELASLLARIHALEVHGSMSYFGAHRVHS